MKFSEELIIIEIEDRMRDFLKAIELDASKKITDYINSLDLNVQEIIETKPLNLLEQIRDIIRDYYDNITDDEDAELRTIEKINEIFSLGFMYRDEVKEKEDRVENYLNELLSK